MREAYRLNKSILSSNGILLGLIFVGNPEMSFSEIEPKMKLALEKLQKEISQNHSEHDSKI